MLENGYALRTLQTYTCPLQGQAACSVMTHNVIAPRSILNARTARFCLFCDIFSRNRDILFPSSFWLCIIFREKLERLILSNISTILWIFLRIYRSPPVPADEMNKQFTCIDHTTFVSPSTWRARKFLQSALVWSLEGIDVLSVDAIAYVIGKASKIFLVPEKIPGMYHGRGTFFLALQDSDFL